MQLAPDIVTLVTGIVGIVALLVAWKSYATASAATRDAHMHALFREYLHFRHEGKSFGNPSDLPETAVSVRLYVLEEMHAWARAERKLAWLRVPPWRIAARRRLIESWEETMMVHASYDMPAAVENIRDYRQCYGEDFLLFLREHLVGERVLATWAGQHFRGGRVLQRMKEDEQASFIDRIADSEEELHEVVEEELKRRRTPNGYRAYRIRAWFTGSRIRPLSQASDRTPPIGRLRNGRGPNLFLPPAAEGFLDKLKIARTRAVYRLAQRKCLRAWEDSRVEGYDKTFPFIAEDELEARKISQVSSSETRTRSKRRASNSKSTTRGRRGPVQPQAK